jgi:hypothetical protein
MSKQAYIYLGPTKRQPNTTTMDRVFNLLESREFYKIFLSLCVFTILIFPLFFAVLRGRSRAWFRVGVEGENNKPDLNEVWEVIYMYVAVGSWLMFVFMILMKTLFAVHYNWEEYSLMFLGTAGSNGVSAWLIYLKSKNKT